MNFWISIVLKMILYLVWLYFSISSFVFMWRNPIANPVQCIRYWEEVVKYEKLDKFQEIVK